MAEQIISPGVFTRENDQTFLPQGVGQIGAAVIGPTKQGPAFVPTVVRSFAEYQRIFGPQYAGSFVPQTVREYLRSAGSVTVCRVLAGGGYDYTTSNRFFCLLASSSANDTSTETAQKLRTGDHPTTLLTVLLPSKATSTPDLGAGSDIAHNTLTPDSTLGTGSLLSDFRLRLRDTANSTITSTELALSMNPVHDNYVEKVLGTNPENSITSVTDYAGTPAFVYVNFKNLTKRVLASGRGELGGYGSTNPENVGAESVDKLGGLSSGSKLISASNVSTVSFNGIGNTEGYSQATTPWVESQFLGGVGSNIGTTKKLFRFHTLAHGSDLNKKYKISIANLREPADIDGEEQYSTFSVILRSYGDKDTTPLIVDQFPNVDLNPESSRYIARVIGDRHPLYNDTLEKIEMLGDYPNISTHVRVEVADTVKAKALSPKLSPKAFAAVYNPIPTSSLSTAIRGKAKLIFPSASYEGTQTIGGVYNERCYLGWQFEDKESDNKNFHLPLPTALESNVSGKFSVENFFGHADSGLWTGSLSASLDVTGTNGPTNSQLKFSIPFQGGDDGIRPDIPIRVGNESTLSTAYLNKTNLFGFNVSSTSAAGYKGYKKAIDLLSNQDQYDINMLALPGVIHSLHSSITNRAIDMVEGRGDAFYVMDLDLYNVSVNTAIQSVSGLDTNYAAVYYPWVKVLDTSRNVPVLVPPSVIVPGAIAASDRIAAEWFAPAGLNRGVLGNVREAKTQLTQAERDKLYDEKINPIATFPQTGVCIWGQKTLQERSTALNRINVRRLLITLKKFIASSTRYLVFEQNTQATRNRFLNIVNPYLETVQQQQGLFAFRVQMDESNNTPDVIDRNQLVGAIFLQPARTAEFIILDFNILPTGATFPS